MKNKASFLAAIIVSIGTLISPAMVYADIPKEKLDALSESDKSTLSGSLLIAISAKRAGLDSSKFSHVLGEDLSDYSLEELEEMQNYLGGDVSQIESEDVENDSFIDAVICDYKLFSIKVVDAEVQTHRFTDDIDLILSVEINNGNDFGYEGYIDTVTVNGWQVDKLAWFNVKAGNKMKDRFTIKLNDLDVFSLDEIESFSICFKLLYAQYYAVTDTVELKLK